MIHVYGTHCSNNSLEDVRYNCCGIECTGFELDFLTGSEAKFRRYTAIFLALLTTATAIDEEYRVLLLTSLTRN